MSKHTPGPWEFDGEYVWADAVRGYVADPNTDDMTSGRGLAKLDAPEMIKANGYLIAAAPELLEALQTMVMHAQSPDFDGAPSDAALEQAIAAIAKATQP